MKIQMTVQNREILSYSCKYNMPLPPPYHPDGESRKFFYVTYAQTTYLWVLEHSEIYRIQPNYHTVRLGFSKLLENMHVPNKDLGTLKKNK